MDEAAEQVAKTLQNMNAIGKVVEFTTPMPTAAHAAAQLGCPIGAIANSLVFTFDDEPLLVIASGAHRVDLDKIASLLELPKPRRASKEFVLEHTGQPVGGVAPIGHPRPIRTVIDTALGEYNRVWAGAGSKYTMFPSSFDELVRLTGGTPAEVGE